MIRSDKTASKWHHCGLPEPVVADGKGMYDDGSAGAKEQNGKCKSLRLGKTVLKTGTLTKRNIIQHACVPSYTMSVSSHLCQVIAPRHLERLQEPYLYVRISISWPTSKICTCFSYVIESPFAYSPNTTML